MDNSSSTSIQIVSSTYAFLGNFITSSWPIIQLALGILLFGFAFGLIWKILIKSTKKVFK